MSEGFQFFISDSAKRRIATMLSDFKLKFEKEAIPAIMWIDSGLNSGAIDSQPAIGLYDHRDEIAPSDILVIDGKWKISNA